MAPFSRFCARKHEAKEERECAKKKECDKSESAERERKKREFELFPPSQTGSQVPKPKDPHQKEKPGSREDVQYSMLNKIITSHNRRQRKRDEGEETDRKEKGKSQMGESGGKRQRKRDRGEETEAKRQRGETLEERNKRDGEKVTERRYIG